MTDKKWPLDPNDLPWGKFVKIDDDGNVESIDRLPEGTKAEYWICPIWEEFWTWRPFEDTKFGVCSKCNVGIVFRESTGEKNGKPPKICIPCARALPINQ